MSAPLRRSAFEAFACPKLYHAKYEEGLDDTSPPALRGIAFHDAAGRYIHALAATGTESDPTLAVQALEEALASRPLPWEIIRDVETTLWPKHVERFQLDLDAFLAAEERQVSEDLSWIPDLVYAYPDVLEIDDWKTYYVGLTEHEARDAFQTLFYLWQAMHVWPGFTTYRMRYVFVRLGYDVAVEFTPTELAAFGDRVQALVAQIKASRAADYWPAIPGLHCRYCVLACDVADDPRRIPLRLTTAEEAQAALLRVTALGRQVDLLRDVLKGYCEQHGDVVKNGVAARHKPVTKRRWALADVVEVLAQHGITDLHELPKMDVAATTIKPLIGTKKRSDIGVDLLQKATVTQGERFEITKPADPDVAPVEEETEVSA